MNNTVCQTMKMQSEYVLKDLRHTKVSLAFWKHFGNPVTHLLISLLAFSTTTTGDQNRSAVRKSLFSSQKHS